MRQMEPAKPTPRWIAAAIVLLAVTLTPLLQAAPLRAQQAPQEQTQRSSRAATGNAAEAAPDTLSEAFELRYVSADSAANGITDFKGATAVFDTEQRMAYLSQWAAYGKHFFDDPNLDTGVFDRGRVEEAMGHLKPSPRPSVRAEIPIEEWKYLGYRDGQRERQKENVEAWTGREGSRVEEGALALREASVSTSFAPQPWRAHFEWSARPCSAGQSARFTLSEAVEVGFSRGGDIYYVTGGERRRVKAYEPGSFHRFKVELDLSAGEAPEATTQTQKTPTAHAIDGNAETAWAAASDGYPQSITFDLGRGRSLRRVRLAFAPDSGRTYTYRLDVSSDRERWRSLGTEQTSDSTARWNEQSFPGGREARYLRVRFTGGSGEEEARASLAEIEVYGPDGRVDLAQHNLRLGRYNLYVDGEKVAAFVPLSQPHEGALPAPVSTFETEAKGELALDDVRVTGFGEPLPRGLEARRWYPFEPSTLIGQDFQLPPKPAGFEQPGYDDSTWPTVPYRRYAHGGERNAGETLYLRKTVDVGAFERAALRVETVRPSGTVYVNGQKIARVGRQPAQLDVTEALRENAENTVAVRVEPHEVGGPIYRGGGAGTREDYHETDVGVARHHMSSDTYSSWFAGLIDLELTEETYIDDVFAYATDVGAPETGDPATLRVQVQAKSKQDASFKGTVVATAMRWYPTEADAPAVTASAPIQVDEGAAEQTLDLSVPDPQLWTTETPRLYKVRVVLKDASGRAVDDRVVTTGLRTVTQEGGTFRVNGEPATLSGPLIFGHYSPLSRIAQWMFSPPERKWVEQILAVKQANGTAFRMSVHDSRVSGINDERLGRIADQLGMMLIWQTPTWVREGNAERLSFEALPAYAKAVRNHPSIVMWQVGNHPGNVSPEWTRRVLDTLSAVDPSRLVSPLADMHKISWEEVPSDQSETYPWWSAPTLARGNMEVTLGYGKDWAVPRQYGDAAADTTVRGITNEARARLLESQTNAWFDFESEETIGQPNWALHEGQPYYHLYSYEKDYDEGSIGRLLSFSEWEESQAWQALSLYEVYRKKRWLDLDGTNWCPFCGGGNSATYMKPLVDYLGHAKLGYHAMRMVYQPVLAGSRNVDVAYGPGDAVPVMVLNHGEAKTVDVTVVVRTAEEGRKEMARKRYEDVRLPAGRTATDLEAWTLEGVEAGRYYGFEYVVTK